MDFGAIPRPIWLVVVGLLLIVWALAPDGLALGKLQLPPSKPLWRQGCYAGIGAVLILVGIYFVNASEPRTSFATVMPRPTPSFAASAPATAPLASGAATVSSGSAQPNVRHAHAERPPLCHESSQWIADEVPAESELVLLVAAGDTIPRNEWANYRRMALDVVHCAGNGSSITLRPITARPLMAHSLEIATPIESGTSYLRFRDAWQTLDQRAIRWIDSLPTLRSPGRGSDPIMALFAAGEDLTLGDASRHRVIIAIFNGWQQSEDLNVFGYRRDPRRLNAQDAVRALQSLPDVHGAGVMIVGMTSGEPGIGVTSAQLAGLCRFWGAIVAASHGSMRLCRVDLPGTNR
jgi:hypothetical protein